MFWFVTVFALACHVIGLAYCLYFAGANLHRTLLQTILKAKMVFFDTKPMGMILNRFSKDMEVLGKHLHVY